MKYAHTHNEINIIRLLVHPNILKRRHPTWVNVPQTIMQIIHS